VLCGRPVNRCSVITPPPHHLPCPIRRPCPLTAASTAHSVTLHDCRDGLLPRIHAGSLAAPWSGMHAAQCTHTCCEPHAHHLMPITDMMRADKLRDTEGRVSAPLDKPTAAWLLEPLRMG